MFLPLFWRLSFPSLFLPHNLPVITEVAKIPSVVPRKKRLRSSHGLTPTHLNFLCARSAGRARISTFRFPGTTRVATVRLRVSEVEQRLPLSYWWEREIQLKKVPFAIHWDLLSGALKDCSWIYEAESALLLSYLLMLTPEDFPNTFALSSCADDMRAVGWSLNGHIFRV